LKPVNETVEKVKQLLGIGENTEKKDMSKRHKDIINEIEKG